MYFVYVGNVGCVEEVEDRWEALQAFVDYVRISKGEQPSRANNEEVVLWDNEDILEHYIPPNTGNEDEDN